MGKDEAVPGLAGSTTASQTANQQDIEPRHSLRSEQQGSVVLKFAGGSNE